MVRSKSYKKNIVCLESHWDFQIEHRKSVFPLIQLTANAHRIKSVHLTSNVAEEFLYNLVLARSVRGYGILYLAFHGKPGKIFLNDGALEIEWVGEFMERRFKDWIVFFDSCGTLKLEKKRVLHFLRSTGVLMVLGFRKEVDWMESAAVDLLLMNLIQEYKDMRVFWDRFRKRYRNLVKRTGLEAFYEDL